MPIQYSLMARSTAPHDPEARWLVYPSAQSRRTVTTRDIAEHIHRHNSPFSVGTIIGLLEDAQQCITEHLAQGDRVMLDSLGAFFTTLSATGVARTEEFTTDRVRSVNLRWRPSRQMKERVGREPLVEVPTRQALSAARRKSKQQLDDELEEQKAERNQEAGDSAAERIQEPGLSA